MCQYTNFVRCCDGDPASTRKRPEFICTQPCELAHAEHHHLTQDLLSTIPDGDQEYYIDCGCPNRTLHTSWVDIKCRWCLASQAGKVPDFGYIKPSEEDAELNPKRIYSCVTDLDPPDLQTYTWYIDHMELTNGHIFNPMYWDRHASLDSAAEPLSPTSMPGEPESFLTRPDKITNAKELTDELEVLPRLDCTALASPSDAAKLFPAKKRKHFSRASETVLDNVKRLFR